MNRFFKSRSQASLDFKDVEQMTMEDARKEIRDLREAIDHHDHLYYVKNRPEISDALYDRLFHRLQGLEDAFPSLQSDRSPTKRVGAAAETRLDKVRHKAPMLSLNAALEESKVRGFYDFVVRHLEGQDVNYVLEPKFDGFSVEVVYENGVFQYGATRGDGEQGEDITKNLMTIRSLPLHLRSNDGFPEMLAVRAEVFMSKTGFLDLNRRQIEAGKEPFANPRNAAAGSMRQLDPKKVENKPLDILFYEILAIQGSGFETHWNALRQFPKWGLNVSPLVKKISRFEEIRDYHEDMGKKREELDYDIDGIVVKLDEFDARNKLGARQRSPRWAFAWKFPPKEEITTLEKIVVQVGRTGMLTPVALLEPVDVGGVTVSRATLHNEDEIRKKDVRPGDQVRIERAGDVIPEVVERIKKPGEKRGKAFSMPKKCPACDADVYKKGAYYFCSGQLHCPPQVTGGVTHYGSRNALNINGLGGKTAEDLVEKGMVKDISDLYTLTEDRLSELEGFARKSAHQLYTAIQETKKPSLDRFLYALGIRHVGQRAARIIAETLGSLDAVERADEETLKEIPEIGPKIAESVVNFFRQHRNKEVLKNLERAGLEVQKIHPDKSFRPLEGKTFVFTGKLDGFTRQEAEEKVEALGGRATSSVSSETDYVVAGKDPGRKYEEARKRKIKILDEKKFNRLGSGSGTSNKK